MKKPRIVIAATSSGTGKTTIVTGLLAALLECGHKVQSFKIGPDYIDPGFHKLASGRAAHNLDSWLVPEYMLPEVFAEEAQDADIAVIEGVMGLYDGGKNGVSSTASIAKTLGAPVILVLNCKSAGESIAATALGFREYDKSVKLQGVILNNLGSLSHGQIVREAVEKLGLKVYGEILRDADISLPERHLGLTPVEEQVLEEKLSKIKQTIKASIDIEAIYSLAETAPALVIEKSEKQAKVYNVKVGVAFDEAFSFYYQTSLATLKALGAEIVLFSPLQDRKLPDVDGLLFGGGFPEMFAKELSANKYMLKDLKEKAEAGLPVYAECGGFMYLGESITDFEGNSYAMAGIIPGHSKMQKKLQTVGYVKAKALYDNLLIKADEGIKGHEFHFSVFEPVDGVDFPWAFEFEKMRTGNKYKSGYAKENVLASYLHMNFLGNREAAESFLQQCSDFNKIKGDMK